MNKIPVEILTLIAELFQPIQQYKPERQPMLSALQSFRLVCRAFRDLSWNLLAAFIEARRFRMCEAGLKELGAISRHPKIAPLITQIAFELGNSYSSDRVTVNYRLRQLHPKSDAREDVLRLVDTMKRQRQRLYLDTLGTPDHYRMLLAAVFLSTPNLRRLTFSSMFFPELGCDEEDVLFNRVHKCPSKVELVRIFHHLVPVLSGAISLAGTRLNVLDIPLNLARTKPTEIASLMPSTMFKSLTQLRLLLYFRGHPDLHHDWSSGLLSCLQWRRSFPSFICRS